MNKQNDNDAKAENRIVKATRELGLDHKEVKLAGGVLTLLINSRKAKRKKDFGEGPKTILEFYEFAITRNKEANAQLFQDLWVQFELGEIRDGFFVEFGATNGVTMSNTYLLEKHYGWTGILAEPNPDFHERLDRERDCNISHKCVYSSTGEHVPFLCTEKGMYSRIKSINPDDHNEDRMRLDPEEVMVETVSLNDLLDEYNAPDTVDFMSVDTEGSELEILQAFDFSKRMVKTFTIEHNFTPMRAAIHELMTTKGYVRRFPEFTRFDDWYIHQDVLAR